MRYIYFTLLVLLFTPSYAYAYVDPGSGMLLWQGLIALIGGLITFIRKPLQCIKNAAKRWLGK